MPERAPIEVTSFDVIEIAPAPGTELKAESAGKIRTDSNEQAPADWYVTVHSLGRLVGAPRRAEFYAHDPMVF